MTFSMRMVARARRYGEGATFEEVAQPDGVTASAVRQSIVQLLGRVNRIAAFYRDMDTLVALRAPTRRERARAAVAFIHWKHPVLAQERRAAVAARGVTRQDDDESAFLESS